MQKYTVFLVLTLCIPVFIICSDNAKETPDLENSRSVERKPIIYPDYTDITIPPNIAPINFIIQEKASFYYVHISSETGKDIHIFNRTPNITIPMKQWQRLISRNSGKPLFLTIFVRDNKGIWSRFTKIKNQIAGEKIDSHLVYRIIKPLYVYYSKMGLYDRNLSTYDERPFVLNTSMGHNCINCHSFHRHNPERMMFHSRAGAVGTSMILAYDGDVSKIDTKTTFNPPTAYRSWHPDGEIIAFSYNVVKQFFHAVGENRGVYDRASDVLLYNIKTNTITTSPKISSKEYMETYPEWAPDGKYLYFCRTPGLESYDRHEHPYKNIKYDLMRIVYDQENDSWGELETVLPASESGLSVAHPKISPDGNYILFCLSEYGNFPLYSAESDFYLLDTRTKNYHKAENINSDQAESYHCWSSNGRWIVFSTKRPDGLFTYAYLGYFDSDGQFRKPFILPQKNPNVNKTLIRIYNVPELVNGPIKIQPQKLIQAAWSDNIIKAELDPKVDKQMEGQPEGTIY
ncbi:PD40 domain-containing protein [candidate division KSB1 bacterium]|nr:PD40 domain-containing protein [candidate division KSB1 bacterium]